jgi:hypothetical protein
MDQAAFPLDLRGLRVRAFPNYGSRVASAPLETYVFPTEATFTAVADERSGGLLIAYYTGSIEEAGSVRLARLSCTEIGR